MRCSKCGTRTKVINSVSDGKNTYRLHKCPECGNESCTIESVCEQTTAIKAKIADLRKWNQMMRVTN